MCAAQAHVCTQGLPEPNGFVGILTGVSAEPQVMVGASDQVTGEPKILCYVSRVCPERA
jgi:hypothetical protein